MNRTNYGPKYTRRITLRLTEEQFETIVKLSDILGVLPAEFLRMTVNTYMHAYNASDFPQKFGTGTITKEAENVNEHVTTDINDIV